MNVRIQVILDESEREAFRREAKRAGVSLSAWVRQVALERLAANDKARAIETAEELRRFFAECDAREGGAEPDWAEHRAVIEESIGSGRART